MDEKLSTLQALKKLVEERLHQVEAAHAILTRSLQQLRAYQAQTRTCPFCGGRMVDLKPLHQIELGRSDGAPIDYYVPNYFWDWECQECWLTRRDHDKPPRTPMGTEERWDRASVRPGKDRTPARLFRKYPRLKTIVKYSDGQRRYWYLATDDGGWYFFQGPAQKLMDWLPDVD